MGMLKQYFVDQLRFLFFRPIHIRPHFFSGYLTCALLASWLCGIGRYWDNPKAEWWQYAGLGSLFYVFILAFILWLLLKPLRPLHWTYRKVLLFVAMTAPPAILYAIPVERFLSLSAAQLANVWFLGIVALWRIALFIRHLSTVGGLAPFCVLVATLLPLSLIVTTLAMLNLEHVVFRLMAGLADHERSANDSAYMVLILITVLSFYAFPITLVGYIGTIIWTHRHKTNEGQSIAIDPQQVDTMDEEQK